jgi:hypothetical protein
MSQDLKKLLQQPPIPPSLITSFLKPSQMGALAQTSKKARASTRQSQAQIQQLDGSRVTNVQQFIQKLASFPMLKKLIFPRTNFTPVRVELLTEILARLPELMYVDLSLNQLPHSTLIVLSQNFPNIHFKVKTRVDEGMDGLNIINGNMVNGVFQGPVIRFNRNGNRFEGNMVNGVFQGPVIKYYANGDRLEGTMVGGIFQGPATYYYANGERLEGSMVRGKFQGPIIYYYANGDRMEGNFVDGVFQGPAITYYANGDRLEGNLVNNTWQRPVIKYFANGTHVQGHIQRGRFIQDGGPPAQKRKSLSRQ